MFTIDVSASILLYLLAVNLVAWWAIKARQAWRRRRAPAIYRRGALSVHCVERDNAYRFEIRHDGAVVMGDISGPAIASAAVDSLLALNHRSSPLASRCARLDCQAGENHHVP